MSLLSFVRGAAFMSAVVVGLCAGGTSARASTFVVNSTGDFKTTGCGINGGQCTLRGAIDAANVNKDFDAIVFDPTVFASKQTITLSEIPHVGGINIRSDLSITGPDTPGAGVTLRAANHHGNDLLRIVDSTVDLANLTFTGAAIGLFTCGCNAKVTGCTFSDNSVGSMSVDLVGILLTKEGVFLPMRQRPLIRSNALTLNNCTVYGNSEGLGNICGLLTLNSCTVTGNHCGFYIYDGVVNLSNVILAESPKGNILMNPEAHFNRDKQSLIWGTATEAGLDPRGLQDNGGPTPTVALVEKSVARGAALNTLPTDQRGLARSQKVADLGAFEFQPVSPSPASENGFQLPKM